jgi:hypothetical protein
LTSVFVTLAPQCNSSEDSKRKFLPDSRCTSSRVAADVSRRRVRVRGKGTHSVRIGGGIQTHALFFETR